ncbi:MAG: HAD-IB family phosphatase [Syntrophorhabdaceae bacterium]|nr:HAD-IB family phosphatase [Syntrophorhabdaceae bacterium]MDD4195057.1 HAD-IB family phosphatase [Syntrophorhabdaceae bacterium]HOC46628.1 HAD-IB family phosphatase [Syntrophorhabdaceae bacterium]
MVTKIVFLDCDGTLTKVKSSWEYLHRRLELWTENADEYQKLFRQGRIDYHEFCRRDALLWRGLSLDDVMPIIYDIPYQPGAPELVTSLKKAGITTVIVSTGLSLLVNRVKNELGIDHAFSNDLLVTNYILSGGIRINVDYDMKGKIVRDMLRDLGLGTHEACAIGDGEGDKGMFEEVGLPIGFNINGGSATFPGRTQYIKELAEAKYILKVD